MPLSFLNQEAIPNIHFKNKTEDGKVVNNEILQIRRRILHIIDTLEPQAQRNERHRKIYDIKERIEHFTETITNTFKSNKEKTHIFNALILATELHIDEEDRLEGQPYLGHVLEVAQILLDEYKITDYKIIVTALLHDSVENNAIKLAKMENFMGNEDNEEEQSKEDKEKITRRAIFQIRTIFEPSIAQTIEILSKPDFPAMIQKALEEGSKESPTTLKNKFYNQYIQNITQDKKALTAKWADFKVNAIEIIERVPESEKKHRKILKYNTALPTLLTAFENLEETHPLFPHREKIIEDIKNTQTKYARYLENKKRPATSKSFFIKAS